MLLPWSDFFDDFFTLTSAEAAAHAELAVSALFSLLGWDFAKLGDKALVNLFLRNSPLWESPLS